MVIFFGHFVLYITSTIDCIIKSQYFKNEHDFLKIPIGSIKASVKYFLLMHNSGKP